MKKIIITILLLGAVIFIHAQQQVEDNFSKESPFLNKIENLESKVESLENILNKDISNLDEYETRIESYNTTFNSQNNEIISLQKKNIELNNRVVNQNRNIVSLKEKNNKLDTTIDSLVNLVQTNTQNIVQNSEELGTEINKSNENANTRISALGKSLENNRWYWIIATLLILLLGSIVYWILRKLIISNRNDVESQIKKTKTALEEESVKLDSKLAEILETQLKLKQEEANSQATSTKNKIDHSLALKVADEAIRIQKNLSQMDENTRGLKQLIKAVKRIQDNLAANGYELVEMLGKEYNDGMRVSANFIPNDKIETGKQIITRIIKPQVNFNGEMIQSAQIEVSIGE